MSTFPTDGRRALSLLPPSFLFLTFCRRPSFSFRRVVKLPSLSLSLSHTLLPSYLLHSFRHIISESEIWRVVELGVESPKGGDADATSHACSSRPSILRHSAHAPASSTWPTSAAASASATAAADDA